MFWWRRSYRTHTPGAQEPVERGEEFLDCAIQFLAKCFGFEAPATRSHFSLHQTQKCGVTMPFVVGEVLHFAILEFLRTGTFGTVFLTFFLTHSPSFGAHQYRKRKKRGRGTFVVFQY